MQSHDIQSGLKHIDRVLCTVLCTVLQIQKKGRVHRRDFKLHATGVRVHITSTVFTVQYLL